MSWHKHFPTFAGWASRLSRLSALRTAWDLWKGIQRRTVLEVGRGMLRVTVWEIVSTGANQVASLESPAESFEQIAGGLEDSLNELGARGLECDLLLHPPWAVAKVLELNAAEAQNPAQWIAQHRNEVFPHGIENDIALTYLLRTQSDASQKLIIGLARRSVIGPLRESVERAGYSVRSTIIGPLATIERLDCPMGNAFAIEPTGRSSVGCWLFQNGEPHGWIEVPVSGDVASGPDAAIVSRLREFCQYEVDLPDSAHVVSVTSYAPRSTATSRWRLPKRVVKARTISLAQRGNAFDLTVTDWWLGWAFRWSAVITVVALLFAGIAAGLSFSLNSLSGMASDRYTAIVAHRETLRAELKSLEKRTLSTDNAGLRLAQLWYHIGKTKPSDLWLRQVKSGATTGQSQTKGWSIEGLSGTKESPQQYTDSLSATAGLNARLTRLERADVSKLKDVPASLKKELYRFAIVIEP